jgi:hypothetical protein
MIDLLFLAGQALSAIGLASGAYWSLIAEHSNDEIDQARDLRLAARHLIVA